MRDPGNEVVLNVARPTKKGRGKNEVNWNRLVFCVNCNSVRFGWWRTTDSMLPKISNPC